MSHSTHALRHKPFNMTRDMTRDTKPSWFNRLPPSWRARVVRMGFNLHPAFRGTGGRVEYVSHDLRHIRVRLRLNWRTRNVVGSLYGGALFAITDGPHPLMLMVALGQGYVVWDKAASIRYRKPGYDTLYADFVLSEVELSELRQQLAARQELERNYTIELKDKHGEIYAVVERTVYIAERSFYLGKRKETLP